MEMRELTADTRAVSLKGNEDVRGVHIVRVRDLLDDLVREKG